jgi:hypothetical protein
MKALRLLLVAPLLGYLALIALAEARRLGAPTLEFAIEGFDPRDLVRGHYLSYRLMVVESDGGPSSREFIACVRRTSGGRATIEMRPPGLIPSWCSTRLRTDEVLRPHRFYVEQDRGLELEQTVRAGRATVRARLLPGERFVADELLVDGRAVSASRAAVEVGP